MADNIRTLPSDFNAEAAVLSAMIIDNNCIPSVLEKLEEKHFYKNPHKYLFKAIKKLFEEDVQIDLITLSDKLKQLNLLDKVGGEQFIIEISEVVLSSANVIFHANIVLQKAILRELITVSNEIIKKSYESTEPLDQIVNFAESEIFKISDNPQRRGFMSAKDIMANLIEEISSKEETHSYVYGIPSGYKLLDYYVGGFKGGHLIILAARPGMGKTSFALNLVMNQFIGPAKSDPPKRVAIFSLEMDATEILARMLSISSGIPLEAIIKGKGLNATRMGKIIDSAEFIRDLPIYIDDNGNNTIIEIRSKSRKLKAELGGLDLIILDYLQLMTSNSRKENRQQEIAEISRNLKLLSRELDVPIIALSQLNRSLESRDDKKPMLSDLRESGAIEQDADLVLFIYRPWIYNKKEFDENQTTIIIGKNRHGKVGEFDIFFKPEQTLFKDLAIDQSVPE